MAAPFDSDMLSFILFCAVIAVAAQAIRIYVRDRPLAAVRSAQPPNRVRQSETPAWARCESAAFQRQLLRFARAVATSYGRGSRHPLEYTTPAGSAFRFTLQREAATNWRVYIDTQPGYRGRADGGHDTHRYVDDSGRHFICWDGTIRGAEQAVFVAARWALLTERYIATGQRF